MARLKKLFDTWLPEQKLGLWLGFGLTSHASYHSSLMLLPKCQFPVPLPCIFYFKLVPCYKVGSKLIEINFSIASVFFINLMVSWSYQIAY